MSKKNAERKKDSLAYHLLPSEEDAPRIYHLKLSEEVAQALHANPGAAVVRLGPGKQDNALKIGNNQWVLQTKPGQGNGSQLDCVVAKGEYYLALGKVSHKLTVPVKGLDSKVVSSFKNKTHEIENQKKSSRAAINRETSSKQTGKQKRKGSAMGETIGESEKKKHKDRDKEDKKAQRMSEAEVRSRIVHWLALRDMDKEELKRKCGVSEIARGLCPQVAQWDMTAHLYRLKPSAVKELNLDDWPHYSDDERRLVRARVQLVSGTALTIANDQEAAKQREEYKRKHQEYLALDRTLQTFQESFEQLGRQLTAADKGTKQEKRAREDIQRKFSSQKTDMMVAHTDFMRLHDELTAIKDGLQAYHTGRAKQRS